MVADRFCIGTRGKINTIMSPQWMVSCDTADNGCNGGEFPTAFQFVETTGLGKCAFPSFANCDTFYVTNVMCNK